MVKHFTGGFIVDNLVYTITHKGNGGLCVFQDSELVNGYKGTVLPSEENQHVPRVLRINGQQELTYLVLQPEGVKTTAGDQLFQLLSLTTPNQFFGGKNAYFPQHPQFASSVPYGSAFADGYKRNGDSIVRQMNIPTVELDVLSRVLHAVNGTPVGPSVTVSCPAKKYS